MNKQQKDPICDFTSDALYKGKLTLHQPAEGYRYSVDASLLTWFSKGEKAAYKCADLGTGCGVVGLGLLASGFAKHVIAVEIQSRLAIFAKKNAKENNLSDFFELVVTDMQLSNRLLEPRSFDLVVSNPPFWTANSGRLPIEEERKISCHEVMINLEGWTSTASKLLHLKRGRLCVVFPSKRLDELLIALSKVDLAATRLLFVHPHAGAPATLVLLEARLGCLGQVSIEKPMFLKDRDGNNTTEYNIILSGLFSEELQKRPDKRGLF